MAICNVTGTPLEKCRDAVVGAAPILDDFRKRTDKLRGGFMKEEGHHPSMPTVCKATGEELFQSYDRDFWIERQTIDIFRKLDVNSRANMADASAAIDSLSKQEDPLLKLINAPWPKECSGY
jgi:hypothetical protein